MKYTIKSIAQGGPAKFLFFWGNQPAKDGAITKSCFSQWWEQPFIEEGIEYKSAEHYMMAKKAVLFNDTASANKIIACQSPAEAKKLGREVTGYDNDLWLANRYNIVKQGNYLKFSQHKALNFFLLQTGDRVLVEASPVDGIWGIGMAANNPDAMYPDKWYGLNLLGFVLMEVRDMLAEKQ